MPRRAIVEAVKKLNLHDPKITQEEMSELASARAKLNAEG